MSISTDNNLLNLDEFISKVNSMKTANKLDLSSDQDLSIALMNLISLEEHFYFSGVKTNNHKFYDLLLEVREIRKNLLKKMVKEGPEGNEIWCISKHLLAASMRIMEVGAKQLDKNNREYACELFQKAYEIYSLFWGINFGIFDSGKGAHGDEPEKNTQNIPFANAAQKNPEKKSVRKKLGDVVRKLINCCLE